MADGVYEARGFKATGCGLRKALEETKLKQGSSVCRHTRGVKVAARILLAGPHSAGNGEMWNTLMAKFSPEDHVAVSAAATTDCSSGEHHRGG